VATTYASHIIRLTLTEPFGDHTDRPVDAPNKKAERDERDRFRATYETVYGPVVSTAIILDADALGRVIEPF
jgi:hypothetical protein